MRKHFKAKNLSGSPGNTAAVDGAEIYNLAREQYGLYADGDPARPFDCTPMPIDSYGKFWSES